MLLARAAAVTAVLTLTAAASGPRILATWPALILIGYLVALVGCVAHRRAGPAERSHGRPVGPPGEA